MRRALSAVVAAGFAVAIACTGSDFVAGDPSPDDAGSDAPAPDSGESADGQAPVGAVDAGFDADDGAAPSFDAGLCNPSMPFVSFRSLGTIVNTNASESTGRLTPDEKTIFVTRASGSASSIRVYARPTVTEGWDGGSVLSVSGAATRAAAWPSANAERVYYEELVAAVGSPYNYPAYWRLWRADYDAGDFVSKRVLSELQLTFKSNVDPYLLPDESALFFASNRTGGSFDLYVAASDHDGGFAAPTALSVNGTADERYPVVSADGTTLYFASDTGRKTGAALYMAIRDANGDFGAPIALKELADLFEEKKGFTAGPVWISPDNCRLYLQTTFDGTLDIFMAWRQ